MLKSIERRNRTEFENIYDKYSPLLYGIVLKFSLNEKEAESILIKLFKIFFSQDLSKVNDNLIFLHMLRITIDVTSEHINLSKQEIGKIILKGLHQNAPQLIKHCPQSSYGGQVRYGRG